MQFFDTVTARHSYRGEFEATPIPREDLVKICQAGIQAPSAGNRQSQRFYVVTNPEMLAKIRDIFNPPDSQRKQMGVATAPALILLVSKLMQFGERGDSPFELQDYGAAAQNVLLAIADLGYSTVWTDGHTNFTQSFQDNIGSIIDLDEDARVRAVLPVGIPKEKGGKQAARLSFDELTKFYE